MHSLSLRLPGKRKTGFQHSAMRADKKSEQNNKAFLASAPEHLLTDIKVFLL